MHPPVPTIDLSLRDDAAVQEWQPRVVWKPE